jgi:hypothetical protein
MKDRVYIFLNKELSNPQKIVQSTHLGIESSRHYKSDIHPSVIVLSITLKELDSIKQTLQKRNINFVDFFEPLFNSVTGLATEPISKDQAKYLQHFAMIKDKDFNLSFPIWHPPLSETRVKLSAEEEKDFKELMMIESYDKEKEFNELLVLSKKHVYEDGISNKFTYSVSNKIEVLGFNFIKDMVDLWINTELSHGLNYLFIQGLFHGASEYLDDRNSIFLIETLESVKTNDTKHNAFLEAISLLNLKETK